MNHSINGTMLEGGNPARTEDKSEARELDAKMQALWEKHPNFHLIRSTNR